MKNDKEGMVRERKRQPEPEINPHSPYNGIKDYVKSWQIFLEEEEGVLTLKDLCLVVVQLHSNLLRKPLNRSLCIWIFFSLAVYI